MSVQRKGKKFWWLRVGCLSVRCRDVNGWRDGCGKRAPLTLKNTAKKKTQQKKKTSERKRAKCYFTAWRAGEFIKLSDVTSYLTPSSSLTPHRPTSSHLSHSSSPPVISPSYSVMAQSPTRLDGKSKNTVLPQTPPVASYSDDPPRPGTVFGRPLASVAEVESYDHHQLLDFFQPFLDRWPEREGFFLRCRT